MSGAHIFSRISKNYALFKMPASLVKFALTVLTLTNAARFVSGTETSEIIDAEAKGYNEARQRLNDDTCLQTDEDTLKTQRQNCGAGAPTWRNLDICTVPAFENLPDGAYVGTKCTSTTQPFTDGRTCEIRCESGLTPSIDTTMTCNQGIITYSEGITELTITNFECIADCGKQLNDASRRNTDTNTCDACTTGYAQYDYEDCAPWTLCGNHHPDSNYGAVSRLVDATPFGAGECRSCDEGFVADDDLLNCEPKPKCDLEDLDGFYPEYDANKFDQYRFYHNGDSNCIVGTLTEGTTCTLYCINGYISEATGTTEAGFRTCKVGGIVDTVVTECVAV